MCRMFLLKGYFHDDLEGIFRSIQLASEKDPFPDPEYKYEHHTHGDGWGYTSFTGGRIVHSRSPDPIFDCTYPETDDGTIMVHSRKTSLDQPRGVLNNHPFVAVTADSIIYLSHNGWVDKFSLNLGIDSKKLEKMTDSEAFLQYIAARNPVTENDLWKIFDGLRNEKVRYTLLNVFITIVDRSGGEPESYYYTDMGNDEIEYAEFDRLYLVGGKNWKGVFSSSLLEFDEFPEYRSKEEVPRGRLFKLQ